MKHTIIATIIALASSSAVAAGFSPWPNPNERAAQIQPSASVTTAPPSFYGAGLPRRLDTPDDVQHKVVVAPFYLANR